MSVKEIIKRLNPIHRFIIHRRRKILKNKDFTLLCSNCTAGLIYHDLGLRFNTPTINCRIASPDFIKLVCNLQEYLSCELKESETKEIYPVGLLKDICIHFVHYKTFDEAKIKWEQRVKRINWNNIYILTNDRDNLTQEDLDKLNNIDFTKHIAVFSTNQHFRSPYLIQISSKHMKNTLKMNPITGKRTFEKYLDYMKWFDDPLS